TLYWLPIPILSCSFSFKKKLKYRNAFVSIEDIKAFFIDKTQRQKKIYQIHISHKTFHIFVKNKYITII
ncbi:MAG TPA: hypothetical protein VJU52_12575, partial [Flavobacterium sp.]|nr:hypothetical protein [Flavobacterium sp.]